jgi:hypothetical protein
MCALAGIVDKPAKRSAGTKKRSIALGWHPAYFNHWYIRRMDHNR